MPHVELLAISYLVSPSASRITHEVA